MNVRDLNLVLRPRSEWEAVDLGTALAKRYYRDLYRMGIVGFGPFVLLLALLSYFTPFLLLPLLWWLKPVLDRFYLYYLSRRIFGEDVSVRQTWAQWRVLLKKGLLPLLIIRRFAPSRSMDLAASDLEKLSGSERGKRCSILSRVGGGQAVLITFGGLVLEALGFVTLVFLVIMFIPPGENPGADSFWLWLDEPSLARTFFALGVGLGYAFLVFLLEPIYLASGFGLYLNSRTSQEAWDIELQFRELASRTLKTRVVKAVEVPFKKTEAVPSSSGAKPGFQFKGSGISMILVVFSLIFGLTSESYAQGERSPQEAIEKVLSDDDFEIFTDTYKQKVEKEGPELNIPSGGAAGAILEGFFGLFGILALMLLVAVIAVVIVNLVKGGPSTKLAEKEGYKRPPPKVVMGLDVTPESLPDDLLAHARMHWEAGEPKDALSLLYRGALTTLITEKEVVIESSDTESECLQQVKETTPGPLANYFQGLSFQWMKAAYSAERVHGQDFEKLCANWPFERRAQ